MASSPCSRSGPLLSALLLLGLSACEEDVQFARSFQIENMAQTIGGPAAAARPGDYLLENDRLRAVVHGRHNMRSTFPIANGSLVDLDIQRPAHPAANGHGRDAFYELGPMVNLKVNSSLRMAHGDCGTEAGSDGTITPLLGAAPCPLRECARITASGYGESIMGILSLLDLAIVRESFDNGKLRITSDYDLCPGEPFVRVSTTASFEEKTTKTEAMEELTKSTGLMDVLLGEHTGATCTVDADCQTGETCEKLLVEIPLGSFEIKMRRCRKSSQKLSGILAGDFTLFSAKVSVFIPGSGFDHESYIRSVFDAGGDTFSAPLTTPYLVGVGDGVSYAYFNQTGQSMIPVFTEAFTATMTNRYGCSPSDKTCLKGKAVRFNRFISVGQGDVASALEGFYRVRQIPTARVDGHVMDQRMRKPLSGMDVFVYREPTSFRTLSDPELATRLASLSPETLEAELRRETRSSKNPYGEPGLISHFKSDVGLDTIPDGSFGGLLPHHVDFCNPSQCRYILVARTAGRPSSPLLPVLVTPGARVPAVLVMGEPGLLDYRVTDSGGRPLPSKITVGHCFSECAVNEDCPDSRPVCDRDPKDPTAALLPHEYVRGLCIPKGGYLNGSSCRPDQDWDPDLRLCACRDHGLLPLSQRGRRFADGTVHVIHAPSGQGQEKLEPGVYQYLVSRGFEYDVQRGYIQIRPGQVTRIATSLPRVVDTTGWISADFHVHGPNSVDASALFRSRVTSFAVEGVELLTATDHDYLTDYAPTIFEMGLQGWLKSQIGTESSPLDYGHFIGFPLRYDENAEQNGGFHWRRTKSGTVKEGDTDFENLSPGDIFKKLRELGSLGFEKTVVFVAHFYDHYTFYDMNPWTLELPSSPFVPVGKLFNTTLDRNYFSGEFDAVEGFNGKNFDIIRRPAYSEVRDYNVNLQSFLTASKNWSYDRRQRSWGNLSAEAQKHFLKRTSAEQTLAIAYSNSSFQCRCMADIECGQSAICDALTGACLPSSSSTRCTSNAGCSTKLVTAGREACQTISTSVDGGQYCRRLSATCKTDADCTTIFGIESDGTPIKETCISGECGFSCTTDNHCTDDPLRTVCDTTRKACTALTPATALDPCPQLRGTVDDWFQMLNHGIRRPFLGNSDTHDTYGLEAGIPRNYVRSDNDLPQAIRLDEIASRVKAMQTFATYGPFVEFSASGGGGQVDMGGTLTLKKGEAVTLKLRVQSPLWFDVDRIEVYRNGELIKEISGSKTCAVGDGSCIKVPNNTIVNYDGTFTDTPSEDAWYAVTVLGLDGKSLEPVYSSTPVARLGMYELIQRLTPLLPPLVSFRTPLSPSMARVRPFALTNPVFADVGGDGLTPKKKLPGWATDADQAAAATTSLASRTLDATDKGPASTEPRHAHPGHDHRQGLGRMTLDAQNFEQLVKSGQITTDMLRQALDSLRYLGR